jgi:hypothetical protein
MSPKRPKSLSDTRAPLIEAAHTTTLWPELRKEGAGQGVGGAASSEIAAAEALDEARRQRPRRRRLGFQILQGIHGQRA